MTSHEARSRSPRRALGLLAAAVSAAIGTAAFSPAAQAAEAGHRSPAASSTAGLVMHRETFTIPAGQTTYRGANATITRSTKHAATAVTCAITVSNPYLVNYSGVEALTQVQCDQTVSEIVIYAYLYSSAYSTPAGANYTVGTNTNFAQVHVDSNLIYGAFWFAYSYAEAYLSPSWYTMLDQTPEVWL